MDRQCTPQPLATLPAEAPAERRPLQIARNHFIFASGWEGTPFTASYERAKARGWTTSEIACGHDVMLDDSRNRRFGAARRGRRRRRPQDEPSSPAFDAPAPPGRSAEVPRPKGALLPPRLPSVAVPARYAAEAERGRADLTRARNCRPARTAFRAQRARHRPAHRDPRRRHHLPDHGLYRPGQSGDPRPGRHAGRGRRRGDLPRRRLRQHPDGLHGQRAARSGAGHGAQRLFQLHRRPGDGRALAGGAWAASSSRAWPSWC